MAQNRLLCPVLRICKTKTFQSLKNVSKNGCVRYQSTNIPKKKTASSVYRTMNIFDRKAKILQKNRAAQSDKYHLSEYIKEEVGWRTADRIFDIKRTFKTAVELGMLLRCGNICRDYNNYLLNNLF